ncbi:unnamed protein product [Lactuca saligna]|uniref:Uncharacterized protein n=1 Tax=Lactuca saligna TaxID=75948 RepID=A0AA35YHV9_LACSI|nr:unnamed protein product [Lactuca saligna]
MGWGLLYSLSDTPFDSCLRAYSTTVRRLTDMRLSEEMPKPRLTLSPALVNHMPSLECSRDTFKKEYLLTRRLGLLPASETGESTLERRLNYTRQVGLKGKEKRPTEATFLSALFKRLASAIKRRQGHKVSEVASLRQEGPIRIPPLFPFPSAPFPRNEKEDGTLELYYLSAYCLPKILLLQLVGHRVIQISRVFRGFPMLQLPYQFGRSGMDQLNIPLGSLVLTFLCGIHSRSALGITSSSGGNSSQNPTTSPTSLPPTLSRTSIET